MNRGLAGRLTMVGGLALVLSLPTRASAQTACCTNKSEAGCKSGQNVGDSCGTGGLKCVQFVNTCGKKSTGVLCLCSNPSNQLQTGQSVEFPPLDLAKKKSETASLLVKNGGDTDIIVGTMLTFGDISDFRCPETTQKIASGKVKNFPVKFDPKTGGDFTAIVHVTSDATQGPMDADVFLEGSASTW